MQLQNTGKTDTSIDIKDITRETMDINDEVASDELEEMDGLDAEQGKFYYKNDGHNYAIYDQKLLNLIILALLQVKWPILMVLFYNVIFE